jgi:PAS domain S-box-containing protein
LIGETSEEHIKRTLEERLPPESLRRLKEIYMETLIQEQDPRIDRNRTKIIEVEYYRADGSILEVSMHISFIRDANGNPLGFQGITRDITKDKEAERRLKESHARLTTIFDSIDEPIFVTDIETYDLLFVNESMKKSFGDRRQKVLSVLQGRTDLALLHNERYLANFLADHISGSFRTR